MDEIEVRLECLRQAVKYLTAWNESDGVDEVVICAELFLEFALDDLDEDEE